MRHHRPPALDVWPSAIARHYLATDRDVITSGQPRRYEEQRRDRHGRMRTYETIKTPVRDASGSIIGTAGISRDITHHKAVERELREQRARSRELSAYLQSIREQERTRISRELHDELGQNLTALRLGLDWIEAQLPPGPGELLTKLASLRRLADATVATMATIASELRPAMLDDLGLAAAVEYLVETAASRSGLRIALSVRLDTNARAEETNTAIFRILQEALTNVTRHARAQNVSVSLTESDGEVALDISDDGSGLPQPPRRGKARGLGLLGMQERASMVGGSLSIDSAPGRGTRLALRVPSHPPHEPDGEPS